MVNIKSKTSALIGLSFVSYMTAIRLGSCTVVTTTLIIMHSWYTLTVTSIKRPPC